MRCSGAVLLRARRNGGSYTSQISAAKGARPRDGSPSTPATQLAQQTRAAAPLVPSFWPPQPPTAESSSAQPNCIDSLQNHPIQSHSLSTVARNISVM